VLGSIFESGAVYYPLILGIPMFLLGLLARFVAGLLRPRLA
jgi:hypothetical protein